jgi:hypothetical protein
LVLVSPADQARKEIRDMVDAITSVVVREHDVDESFVISEIKAYISGRDFAEQNDVDLKVIQYTRKQKLGGGNLGTVLNGLRSKVQWISSIRFASSAPKGSN